jgi:hypothetical protein
VNMVDVFCIYVWKYISEACWNCSKEMGKWDDENEFN